MVSKKQKFYSIFFKSRLSLHPVFKSNFRRMERSDILRGNGHKTCFEKNPKHCPSPTAQGRVVEAKKLRWSKTKVFVHLLKKVVVSRGNAFGRLLRKAEARVELVQLLSSGAFEEVSRSALHICAPSCKRKGFQKPIVNTNYPSKIIRWMIFDTTKRNLHPPYSYNLQYQKEGVFP